MKAHRTDLVSFAFGLLFLALSAWWLLAQLLGLVLPPVGWFLAGALILIGVFGLVGALRSGQSGRPTPDDVAPTTAGTEPGEPTSGAPTLTFGSTPTWDIPPARSMPEAPAWDASPSRPMPETPAWDASPARPMPEVPAWDASPARQAAESPTAESRTPTSTLEPSTADMIHPAWLAHSATEPEPPTAAAEPSTEAEPPTETAGAPVSGPPGADEPTGVDLRQPDVDPTDEREGRQPKS
ncbi:hypothetical protein F4558_006118 [Micromonospora profundi]|nr:hypothetical protein [Micromonospora profundi]